jgi:hypothetical protein
VDVPKAIAALKEFDQFLAVAQGIYYAVPDDYYKRPEWASNKKEIDSRLPVVERLAEAVDHNLRLLLQKSDGQWGTPHENARTAVTRLIGLLEQQGDLDEILGPTGPRLSAEGLHPWVWHAAVDLWDGGHYRQAVQDAYTKVETMTQQKSGRVDASGKALWGEVFSLKPGIGRLRFTGLNAREHRFTSAHEGAMYLGMASAEGLRNWAAHTLDEGNEQLALEYVATLSVLARWVDEAEPEP